MATATSDLSALVREGVLEGTHSVITPEYVEFRFVLAGLYSRFLAWLVDGVVVIFGTMAIMAALSAVMAAFPGFASALGFIVYFLFDWGYAIALETAWSGQTLGKRLMGLRVIQESGVRVGFLQAALRNLVRPIDRLPLLYLVGAATALVTRSQQRLGDLLAGTIVVKERRLKIPANLGAAREEERVLDDPSFLARVNQLGPEEQEVLLSAALRREELTMQARLALFGALSARLQERGFDKPEHRSDEKLVLLVVAALARRAAARQGRLSTRTPGRR